MKERSVLCETHGEEIANSISHAVGAVLSVIGLAVMVKLAIPLSAWHVTGVSIFGGSLVLLYGASAVYHFVTSHEKKRIFQILDHALIFVLIAGSYTPRTLGLVAPRCGVGSGAGRCHSENDPAAAFQPARDGAVYPDGLDDLHRDSSAHGVGQCGRDGLARRGRFLLHWRGGLLPDAKAALRAFYLASLCPRGEHLPFPRRDLRGSDGVDVSRWNVPPRPPNRRREFWQIPLRGNARLNCGGTC
jgi:hypothetical protein